MRYDHSNNLLLQKFIAGGKGKIWMLANCEEGERFVLYCHRKGYEVYLGFLREDNICYHIKLKDVSFMVEWSRWMHEEV